MTIPGFVLNRTTRGAILAIGMAIGVAGCAAMDKSDAMDTERVLAAAGFQMKFADTSEQQEQVKKLPQRKISHVKRNGELLFIYPDSKYCKCMYVGSETAYQRYEKLALERNMAAEESMAVQDADMQWGAWGGWGPWD